MIIFTKSSDLDPILFWDSAPLKQIISGPGGSESGPQYCFSYLVFIFAS
jgi:hypothetical protein